KITIKGYEAKIKEYNAELTVRSESIEKLQNMLQDAIAEHNNITSNSEAEFNNELDANKDYTATLASIAEMESAVQEEVQTADNSELKEKKMFLKIEVDTIKRQLNDEEIIKKAIERR